MKRFVDGLSMLFGTQKSDGLIRMFETEYNKEYRAAIKHGIRVDDHFVREFLKAR